MTPRYHLLTGYCSEVGTITSINRVYGVMFETDGFQPFFCIAKILRHAGEILTFVSVH